MVVRPRPPIIQWGLTSRPHRQPAFLLEVVQEVAVTVLDHMGKNPEFSSFTIVEILVVIGIIVLLTGLSLASYNRLIQEKNLEKEINRLIDVLSLAKSKAQSGDVNTDCSTIFPLDTLEFGGYRVEINTANYSFRQSCRDINTKVLSAFGSIIQSYDFPLVVSNTSALSTVDFYPLSGGATNTTLTIKNSSINECLDLTISETGVITAGDTNPC